MSKGEHGRFPRQNGPSGHFNSRDLTPDEWLVWDTVKKLGLKSRPTLKAGVERAASFFLTSPTYWWTFDGETAYESSMAAIVQHAKAFRERGAPRGFPPIEDFWYWVALRQLFGAWSE